MKTVSIRERHDRTGILVREAAAQPIQVTYPERVDALRQAPTCGTPLPDREPWIASLPNQASDSADLISADRDR